MYHRGSAAAFTGFAVAGDASGVFRQLGLAGPLLSLLHVLVGGLLAIWLVAFLYALTLITIRRLGRTTAHATAPLSQPAPVPALARRSSS